MCSPMSYLKTNTLIKRSFWRGPFLLSVSPNNLIINYIYWLHIPLSSQYCVTVRTVFWVMFHAGSTTKVFWTTNQMLSFPPPLPSTPTPPHFCVCTEHLFLKHTTYWNTTNWKPSYGRMWILFYLCLAKPGKSRHSITHSYKLLG